MLTEFNKFLITYEYVLWIVKISLSNILQSVLKLKHNWNIKFPCWTATIWPRNIWRDFTNGKKNINYCWWSMQWPHPRPQQTLNIIVYDYDCGVGCFCQQNRKKIRHSPGNGTRNCSSECSQVLNFLTTVITGLMQAWEWSGFSPILHIGMGADSDKSLWKVITSQTTYKKLWLRLQWS